MSHPVELYESIIAEMRRRGLKVAEVSGWRRRSAGGSHAPVAVMFHHTASSQGGGNAPAHGTVNQARSDLQAPLCNFHVARNGKWTIVAAGRANHAGPGGPWRSIPSGSGSTFSVGIEVENNGVGEPWSDRLTNNLEIGMAAILRRLGRNHTWCLGHKEWTSRKIDPGGLDMSRWRGRLRKQLGDGKGGASGPPPWPGRFLKLKDPPMRGEDVRRYKRRLRRLGHEELPADNVFGPGLDKATRALQKRKGLDVDGTVGPDTWRAAFS